MSENKKQKILYIATHGPDDPERATLPFVLGNAALAMDVEPVIALQGTAVLLARKNCAEHVFAGGLPPLKTLFDSYMEMGGRLLVCSPCIQSRKIDPVELVEGAEIVAAATMISEILSAKAVLNY